MTTLPIPDVAQEVEALKAKADLQTKVLRSATHQWRFLLQRIVGNSQALIQSLSETVAQEQLLILQQLSNDAQELTNSIDELVAAPTVIKSDDLELETFYLAPDVNRLVMPFQSVVAQRPIEFKIECSPDTGNIHGDKRRLYTVLKALLANAVKFTERGSIVLSIHRLETAQGEQVVFELNDTGIGMLFAQVEKLNRILAQPTSEAIKTGIQEGVIGVGLTLAARNCQIIGGRISISSDFGQGTRCIVTIPAQLDP